MTDITISNGAPSIDPGVYLVTLLDIGEPREFVPQTGPNAGETVKVRDWKFAVGEDGEEEFEQSVSLSTGPRSNTYKWMTALLGGVPPQVGQTYPKAQLVGREAIATIEHNATGWPKITNLSAKPVAKAKPSPVAAAPVQQAADGDLPF
jgi:hypothetical protein